MPKGYTLYSTRTSRREARKERRSHWLEWLLIGGACVVIGVFVYLIFTGGL